MKNSFFKWSMIAAVGRMLFKSGGKSERNFLTLFFASKECHSAFVLNGREWSSKMSQRAWLSKKRYFLSWGVESLFCSISRTKNGMESRPRVTNASISKSGQLGSFSPCKGKTRFIFLSRTEESKIGISDGPASLVKRMKAEWSCLKWLSFSFSFW